MKIMILVLAIYFLLPLLSPVMFKFLIGPILFRRIRKTAETLLPDQELSPKEAETLGLIRAYSRREISRSPGTDLFKKEIFEKIFLIGQNGLTGRTSDEIRWNFTIDNAVSCLFLILEELKGLSASSKLLRKTMNRPLRQWVKVGSMARSWDKIYGSTLGWIDRRIKFPVTGRIIRVALVPLLGVPSVVIFPVVYLGSLVPKIIQRYLLGTLVYRTGIYGLLLHTDRKSEIQKRISMIPVKEIKEKAKMIEKKIKFTEEETLSDRYPTAYHSYQDFLREQKIYQDTSLTAPQDSSRSKAVGHNIGRTFQTALESLGRHMTMKNTPILTRKSFMQLFETISEAYGTTGKGVELLYPFTPKILLETAEMAIDLSYNYVRFTQPLIGGLKVNIAVTVAQTGFDLASSDLGLFFKHYRHYRKINRTLRAVTLLNPGRIALSFSGTIAADQAKIQLQNFIYHRAGRLSIWIWESTVSSGK